MEEALLTLLIMVGLLAVAALVVAILALRAGSQLPNIHEKLNYLYRRLERMDKCLGERAVAPEPQHEAAQETDEVVREDHEPTPPPVPVARVEAPATTQPTPPPQHEPPPQPEAPARPEQVSQPPAVPVAPAYRALSPPPMPERRAAKATLDWEQWLGIRGAALMGAVVLALAGLYFFKYSIDHGWISPAVRVILGTVTGLACLGGAEILRRRGYFNGADALAGGGIVILYAAFWAAHVMYGLINAVVAFGLMALLTAGCVALSAWRSTQVVAIIGLFGGFLTPWFVSGVESTLGLFGYLLILDAGIVGLAIRRKWPRLALMAVIGTTLHEAVFIATRIDSVEPWSALLILALFAALFGFTWRLEPENGSPMWRITQYAGILIPLSFGIYFSGQVELQVSWPALALFMLLLCAAACTTARRISAPGLATAAAAAVVGIALVWVTQHPMGPVDAWLWIAGALGLGLVFHLFGLLERGDPIAATVTDLGLLAVSVIAAMMATDATPWPWLSGWLVWVAFGQHRVLRLGTARDGFWLPLGLGVGAAAMWMDRVHRDGFVPEPYLAVLIVALLGLQLWLWLQRRDRALTEPAWVWQDTGANLAVLVPLFFFPVGLEAELGASVYYGFSLLLGLLAVVGALRASSGIWYLLAMALTVLTHFFGVIGYVNGDGATVWTVMAAHLMTTVVFTAIPFGFAHRLREAWTAWIAAALAAAAWFIGFTVMYHEQFGDGTIGLAPIILAIIPLTAAYVFRRIWPVDHPRFKSGLVWFLGVSLGLMTAAIPLQLEQEWITVAFALEALVLSLLWLRLDHHGLKLFVFFLALTTALRLTVNPALLDYYPQGGGRIFNWLMYTYLVPVAALVAIALNLRKREPLRLVGWESSLFRGRAWVSLFCGAAAVLLGFVWLNLAINHYFRPDQGFEFSLDRLPARDLTFSIAWVLYALGLMVLGIARRMTALRRVSLGVLILTICKVFLYDLGELTDLYRVASLLGLAISLIMVSVVYQKFVATSDDEAELTDQDSG